MLMLQSPFNSHADARLLQWLASQDYRPNFLLECRNADFDDICDQVSALCAPPVRVCSLPGALRLPRPKVGTLVLKDVAALGRDQQLALYDWLSAEPGEIQVVSVASAPLTPLIEDGAFFEALYYRLNVIRLDLTAEGDED
jgi:hypothetical protein